MKVFFIISDMDGGGTQRVVSLLSNQMIKKNSVVICTITKSKEFFKIDKKIKRIKLNFLKKKQIFFRVFNFFKKIFTIRRLLKEYNDYTIISLIHGTNIIVLIALIFSNKKLIICERNDVRKQKVSSLTNFLRFITYGLANAVTTNLESNIKNLNYLRKKKIHFLPNPVKIPRNIKRSKKENFILSVGRLHLQKNYFQLLRAFKEFSKYFPDWKYIIVGKGKLEKKIKNLINSLELQDRVILKGFTDPQPYYKKAAFVLFGSHYEGMPNVILESMANNVPVLTSNFQGIEKLIKNNKNGLVFTLNSDKDLIKKMIFMANRDNSRFISNAYKDVSKFNLKKITEDWVKLINNI